MDKKYILARNLRKNATPQEKTIWEFLRNRQFKGLKFKRQQPVAEYIVDFLCKEKMLIIEIDGGQHNFDENAKLDEIRTKKLEELGYKVIRFWNNEIYNLEGIYSELEKYL